MHFQIQQRRKFSFPVTFWHDLWLFVHLCLFIHKLFTQHNLVWLVLYQFQSSKQWTKSLTDVGIDQLIYRLGSNNSNNVCVVQMVQHCCCFCFVFSMHIRILTHHWFLYLPVSVTVMSHLLTSHFVPLPLGLLFLSPRLLLRVRLCASMYPIDLTEWTLHSFKYRIWAINTKKTHIVLPSKKSTRERATVFNVTAVCKIY